MRLICPNCGAQYEVDGTVIPDGGRDVQCSNCGHTWFQRQSQQDAESVQTFDETPDQTSTQSDQIQAVDEPETNQDDSEQSAAAFFENKSEPDFQENSPEAPAAPERQELDENLASILREEASLESSQRLQANDRAQSQSGTEQDSTGTTADQTTDTQEHSPGSVRSDILPDIEELNSTLAAAPAVAGSDDSATEVPEQEKRRSGFRRGLLLAILLFVVLALIYLLAPKIATAVPATASVLATYVDWVNSLRMAMDGLMLGIIDKLTGLLAQLSGGEST
ncbi:MAG: zinc-ribbon domain-containing protein [Paracoccaceae bacterium]